jgi:hypothetical protein
MAGMTAAAADIPPAKEPSGFDLLMRGLERIGTDLVTTDSRPPRTADGAKGAALFDSSGAPRLASPAEAPQQYQPAISLEQQVSQAEASRVQFNASLINDRANEGYNAMKQRVDKHVDAQLKSIDDFKKASDELAEKLGKWYYQVLNWVSDNLGPAFPYIGLAIAGIVTFATAGAAWPLLAMAVANVANHVLKKNGIDVIAKAEGVIGKLAPILGEAAAKDLGKRTAAIIGALVADPEPVGKLFSSLFSDIAKKLNAGKSVIEFCELAGQILGTVITGAIGIVAGGGAGVASAAASAVSAIRAAVTAPVATAQAMAKAAMAAVKQFLDTIVASVRNMAENGAKEMAAAVQQMIDAIVKSVRNLIDAIRQAGPRLEDAASSMFSGPNGMTMPRFQDAAKFVPSIKDLQGITPKYGVNMARAATSGTQSVLSGTSAVRDFDLAFTQKYIDDTATDRNRTDQILDTVRQERDVTEQAMQRQLQKVSENAKVGADTIRSYNEGAAERARIQAEQMTPQLS